MNENIDLTKILKDCPKGTKLYSKVHGEVTLTYISVAPAEKPIVVLARPENSEPLYKTFTSKGQLYNMYDAECILVPSKNQQDWSKFTAPWYKKEKFDPKTLKPFDRVIVNHDEVWKVDFFSHINQYEPNGWCQCIGDIYYNCIPYNNETKHLVGTRDEVSEFYRYWED